MASNINEHISADERTKWNKNTTDIAAHVGNAKIHVPNPPATGNYYLGNDLKWHQTPVVSISVS